MHPTTSLIHRTSALPKIVKFNILMLSLLVIATTMVVSFADTATPSAGVQSTVLFRVRQIDDPTNHAATVNNSIIATPIQFTPPTGADPAGTHHPQIVMSHSGTRGSANEAAAWTTFSFNTTAAWQASGGVVTIPSGYEADGYACRLNSWDPANPVISQPSGGPGESNAKDISLAVIPGNIHQNVGETVPKASRVLCEFLVTKSTAPASFAASVYARVRVIDASTGGSSNSLIAANAEVSTTGTSVTAPVTKMTNVGTRSTNDVNTWAAISTFDTTTPWNFKAGLVTIPTGYIADGHACRPHYFDPAIAPVSGGYSGGTSSITYPVATSSNFGNPYNNIATSVNIYCEFLVAKDTTTTTSSSTTSTTTTTMPATTPTSSISIKKTVTPTSAKPGDTVTYSFVVTNTGNTTLDNVKVTDTLLGGQVGTTLDTLAPGAIEPTITKTYVIPSTQKDTVHNTATATGTPDLGNGQKGDNVTATDSADVTIIPANDTWVAVKTADVKTALPGQTVNYTITVTNNGTTTLKNFQVSDPTIKFPSSGLNVQIPSLAPGESKAIPATYVIPLDYKDPTFTNTALVCLPAIASLNTDADTNSATQTDCQHPPVTINIANIKITKTADKDTAVPGDKVTYTFVVKNTGGVDLDPTAINDNILGVIGDPGVIKPGESSQAFTKDYTVPSDAKDGSTIVNTATVCAPVPDSGIHSDALAATDCLTTCPTATTGSVCSQDSHTLTVNVPSITIVKTADKDTASVGDTVNYTFVITNTSKITLTNITVVDNILGDLGTIPSLGPDLSVQKVVPYVVPADGATSGTIHNVATACFTTPVYANPCASDDHTLTVTQVLGTSVTRPASTGSLPFTGAQTIWLATFAGLVMMLGSVLFTLARKRKGHGATA